MPTVTLLCRLDLWPTVYMHDCHGIFSSTSQVFAATCDFRISQIRSRYGGKLHHSLCLPLVDHGQPCTGMIAMASSILQVRSSLPLETLDKMN